MNPRSLGILAPALSPDPRESIRLARTLGFPGVQLDVTAPGLPLKDLGRSAQRELLKFVSDHNVSLRSLVTSAGKKGLAPGADIDRALDHLTRAMQSAADLGRVVLCVDLGPLPPPPPEVTPPKPKVDPALLGPLILPTSASLPPPPAPVVPRDEAFESTLDAALIELGRRADRFGVLVAFRSDLGALGSLHRALRAAACPYFTLDLDPVAVLRDTWSLEQTLGAFAGQIAHLRLRDARQGTAGRTQPAPIGQGSTPIPELLRLLDEAGFSGPIVVDPTDLRDRPAAASQALNALKTL